MSRYFYYRGTFIQDFRVEDIWARALDVSTRIQDSTATTPTNQAIVNLTPKCESEQALDRFLGVSVRNQDPTVSTTAAVNPMNDATELDAAGRPHYKLEDLLEDSTSATKALEDATSVVAVVEENHLTDKEMRRAFWDGYEQGVEDEREQDSSSGSGSDNPGSIDSASDDDDHDDHNAMENHDDYEQGYSDGYYDGQDDAYDYSDHQEDY